MPPQRRLDAVFGIRIASRVKLVGYPQPAANQWQWPKIRLGRSVAGTRLWRKIFLEFAFLPLEILGLGRRFLLLGNIRPSLGVFGVHLKPFFQARFGIRLDGIGGTFGLAHAAI